MPFHAYPINSRKGRRLVRKSMRKPVRAVASKGYRKNQGPASSGGFLLDSNFNGFNSWIGKCPFPTHQTMTFNYSDFYNLTTGAGVYGTDQKMRMNALYDPDLSGTGRSCKWLNIYQQIYNQYRVEKVDWEVVFTTIGLDSDILCSAMIYPDTTGSLTGTARYFGLEADQCQSALLPSSGERRATLRGSTYIHEIFGIERIKLISEDDYSSGIFTNPAGEARMSIATISTTGATGVACTCIVRFKYHVRLYNRRTS